MTTTAVLICPIGIPGSGKSHLAASLVAEGHLPAEAVVSPDDFRLALTGSTVDQTANGDAFAICNRITSARLSRGLPVFYDATHLTASSRTLAAQLAEDAGAAVLWVDLNTTQGNLEALVRNDARPEGRKVPMEVMIRMLERMGDVDWESLAEIGLVVTPAEVVASLSSARATVPDMK